MSVKQFITLTFTLTFTLAFTLTLFAAPTNELDALNQNIAHIKQSLQKATLKKTQLENALAMIETDQGQINQKLKSTQKALSSKQLKLTQLEKKSAPLIDEKNQTRVLLKKQIRAAYIFSQQPYLKVLLSPNNIEQTQRLLMYYRYITQAQLQTMSQLQSTLTQYQQNQAAIQDEYQALLQTKVAQLQNEKTLEKTKDTRQELIQKIDHSIQTKNEKLNFMLQNKHKLEETLRKLTAQTTQMPLSAAVLGNHPFASLRGKLSWPASGQVEHNFGNPIEQSELRWDGTLIDAKPGTPVHAVASGSVIFAKWLEGYGLLVIINNGNGYMTLYGRNQSINVKTGDHVVPGEMIGRVGNSGGFHHTALYFSIRHFTKALNPMHWCR